MHEVDKSRDPAIADRGSRRKALDEDDVPRSDMRSQVIMEGALNVIIMTVP